MKIEIKQILAAFVTVVVFLALFAGTVIDRAHAQPVPCDRRQKMVEKLAEKFAEERVGIGIAGADNTTIVEVYRSPAGTWTVIGTTVQGISCIITAGTAWEDAE